MTANNQIKNICSTISDDEMWYRFVLKAFILVGQNKIYLALLFKAKQQQKGEAPFFLANSSGQCQQRD